MKKNNIIQKQADYIYDKLEKEVEGCNKLSSLISAISKSIQKLIDIAFKPSFRYKYSAKLDREEQTNEIDNIILDLNVINETLTSINDDIADKFNNMQDFKTKSKNELNELKSYVRQLDFLNGVYNCNSFVNTFNNYNQIVMPENNTNVVNIMTSEGIATLPISASESIKAYGSDHISINTNGEVGNFGLIEKNKYEKSEIEEDIFKEFYFLSDVNAHDDPAQIMDGNPDTWLEIQNLNEELKAEIKFDFGGNKKINWINISPYIPKNSNNSFLVESIKYRNKDGITQSVFNEDIINKKIGLSFSSNNINKYYEQGVFTFPTINANQLIFTFKQDFPYKVKKGKYKYYQKINNNFFEADESSVPKEVASGKDGIYYTIVKKKESINGASIINEYTEVYKKEIIQDSDPMRYMIGIRDIEVKYNTYLSQSEIISIPYSHKNIKNIKLAVDEEIPSELLNKNSIQYFISLDDTSWYKIRPYNIINKEADVVPISYEINSNTIGSDKKINVNIGYIEGNYDKVRLKIVLNNSTSLPEITPILKEYALIVS